MKANHLFPVSLWAVALAALVSVPCAAAEPPLMMIRLRGPNTADDAQWAKTFKALRENRGACDDVWFSTGIGFPKIEWHAAHAKRLVRYADDLRSVGIMPSLQFQATLGHSDEITLLEGVDGKTWGGFTGRGGTEGKACNCPRQPGFLAYVREMARLYASFKPSVVWIDDDLRIAGHAPASPWGKVPEGWIGCWCPTCLAAFNAETGGKWTRETLDAAMKRDTALFDRWEKFSFAGIAEVARVIAEETHKVSPETRLAYQHGRYRNDSQLTVYRAMHEATGLPVGARPGGGAYFDYNPNDQMVKAFGAAHQRNCLGNPEWIEAWCPEIETWPRAFASRTAQGLLNEAFVNLAYGMNCLSFLIMSTRHETDEWYSENLLAPLAAEKPCLEAYRRHNAGALPAGLADATKATPEALYRFALAGVPVLPGPGKAYGEVTDADLNFSGVCAIATRATAHVTDAIITFLIASLLLFKVGRKVHFTGDLFRLFRGLAPRAIFPRRRDGIAFHAKCRDRTHHEADQPPRWHLFSGEVADDRNRFAFHAVQIPWRIHPLRHEAALHIALLEFNGDLIVVCTFKPLHRRRERDREEIMSVAAAVLTVGKRDL
jgi:hypothetical protein